MQTKIRVGAVSYLNTKPLLYGFDNGIMADMIDIRIDYPSRIASMLLENSIDVGLVPVVIIPQMKEHYIISDYCIGCDGEVASVCLFSEVPLDKIEKILLDYQSKTSITLLKILSQEFWKINSRFEQASPGFQSKISGTTAALVIGDRALELRKVSPYIYDLGLEWKKFTGLPFVFAAWISNKKLDADFINLFNEANAYGLSRIEEIVKDNPYMIFDLHSYYSRYIKYDLNLEKRKALEVFLKKDIKSGFITI
ncbi:MAG TPA: menaquinone biosynthesis protein [Chitinophagaceae bacterium]|nr:menaquinone biosynthesis protein [Chitinophagaceae bacterium]